MMEEKYKETDEATELSVENGWSDLEKLGRTGFAEDEQMADSDNLSETVRDGLEPGQEQGDVASDEVDVEPAEKKYNEIQRAAAKVRDVYAKSERQRIDRLKADMDEFPPKFATYEEQGIAKEPTTFQKAIRLLGDKLGIKTGRGEERREREAMHKVLLERRREEAAAREEVMRKDAEFKQREAEREAQLVRSEQEFLTDQMAAAHSAMDRQKSQRLRMQRIQEIVERDLNSRLLKADALEVETLAENPGIQKCFAEFEGAQIPVYDLRGIPFMMLSTTIDYRSATEPGKIGTETYRAVMKDPAVWDRRRHIVEKESGFGMRRADAYGDTISASYYNSERNLDSHVSGDLMYGFEKVEGDAIVSITDGDGATVNTIGKGETSLTDPNALQLLEGAEGTQSYNEVLLRRYSENGVARRPDYIIIEDGRMTEAALRHAKFYDIPIVNIERSIYQEKAERRGRELLDSISENDSYPELDKKLEELLSMSSYKWRVRTLRGIGRSYDIPQMMPGYTGPLYQQCLEVAKLEQRKRLEFVKQVLLEEIERMEANEVDFASGERPLTRFDRFEITLNDVQNGVRSTEFDDTRNIPPRKPGDCNSINITLRLKGSSRTTLTEVYDGERIFKADEALASGEVKQEDLDKADSSYYEELEPIVRKYFAVIREKRRESVKQ